MTLFKFHPDRARRSIEDPNGAIWPINAFSDADELNCLFEAALDSDAITSHRGGSIYVYPLSIAEHIPVVVVDPGHWPMVLGHSLKLRERDGENPLEFTLRLLGEIVGEANALTGDLESSR